MAKLTLEVESNALEVFNKTTASMNNLVGGINDFEKQGKESFNKVTKAAEDYTQTIKTNATETVNGVNKVINSRQREKQEILLLKAQIADVIEYEKKLKEQRDKTAPGAQQSGLNKKLAEAKFDLKGMEEELKKLEEAEKKLEAPIVSLRTQLKLLKEQIANSTDPEEFARLSQEAGTLQDKISDAGDSIAAFSKESKASTAKTIFSQLLNDIGDLDFKGAADKAKQFGAVMKSITLKETVDGIKSLGTALISVGKSLLANPFFALVAAIVAVGLAIKGMVDSAHAGEQALKDNAAAMKEVMNATDDLIRANRDLALENDITTKKIKQFDGERLKNQNQFKDAFLEIAEEQRKKMQEHNEKMQKEREEDGFHATKALYEFFGGETELTKRQKIGLKDIEENYEKQRIAVRERFRLEDNKIRAEDDLEKERKQKEFNDKMKQYQKDLAQALLDLSKRSEQAELDGMNGEAKINKQREISEKEIEALRKVIIEKGKLVDRNFKFTAEQEAEFAKLKTQINKKYYDDLLALAVETATKEATINKSKVDTELGNLELRNQIAVNILETSRARQGADLKEQKDFEESKAKALLFQQIKYEQDKLDVVLKSIEAEKALRVAGLNAELGSTGINEIRKKAIEQEINSINETSELTKQVAISNTNKILTGIDDEINTNSVEPLNWDTLFNLPAGAFEAIKAQLQDLSSSFFAFANQQLDSELDIIDKRISNREKDIDDLESKLNAEKELKAQGLANNVDLINQQLVAQEEARKKDLQEQKKIQEEKKKLAKAQFVIDTAIQGSNLITAVTQVFATYGKFPILAGLLAAAMIGSFTLTKATAYKAISQGNGDNNFKDGVIDLQGPGTETSDSIKSNLSKGESVMTAKETRKHKQLFLGIRKNNPKLIEIGIAELLKNTGVSLPKNVVSELSATKEQTRAQEIKIMMPKQDGETLRINSIEQSVKELVSQGKSTIYIDGSGNQVIKRGSLTQIILKK